MNMEVESEIENIRESMYQAQFQNEITSLKEEDFDAEWVSHRIDRLKEMINPSKHVSKTKWKMYKITEQKVTIAIYVNGSSLYYFSKGGKQKDTIAQEIVAEFRSGRLFKTKKIDENDAIELSPSDNIVKYLETI